MSSEPTPEQRRAMFQVVRGEPTDAEVAALTVVLAAMAAGSVRDVAPRPRSAWSDPRCTLRGALTIGPGAWGATYWPR